MFVENQTKEKLDHPLTICCEILSKDFYNRQPSETQFLVQNLQCLPIFSTTLKLTENDKKLLFQSLKCFSYETFQQDNFIRHAGQDVDGLYIILQGCVRSYRIKTKAEREQKLLDEKLKPDDIKIIKKQRRKISLKSLARNLSRSSTSKNRSPSHGQFDLKKNEAPILFQNRMTDNQRELSIFSKNNVYIAKYFREMYFNYKAIHSFHPGEVIIDHRIQMNEHMGPLVAWENTHIVHLSYENFSHIFSHYPELRNDRRDYLIAFVPGLDKPSLYNLLIMLEPKNYKQNDKIFSISDDTYGLYFIKAGEVLIKWQKSNFRQLTTNNNNKPIYSSKTSTSFAMKAANNNIEDYTLMNKELNIVKLKYGEFFGEEELLELDYRSFDAIAITKTVEIYFVALKSYPELKQLLTYLFKDKLLEKLKYRNAEILHYAQEKANHFKLRRTTECLEIPKQKLLSTSDHNFISPESNIELCYRYMKNKRFNSPDNLHEQNKDNSPNNNKHFLFQGPQPLFHDRSRPQTSVSIPLKTFNLMRQQFNSTSRLVKESIPTEASISNYQFSRESQILYSRESLRSIPPKKSQSNQELKFKPIEFDSKAPVLTRSLHAPHKNMEILKDHLKRMATTKSEIIINSLCELTKCSQTPKLRLKHNRMKSENIKNALINYQFSPKIDSFGFKTNKNSEDFLSTQLSNFNLLNFNEEISIMSPKNLKFNSHSPRYNNTNIFHPTRVLINQDSKAIKNQRQKKILI